MRSEPMSDVYPNRGNFDVGREEDAGMLAWMVWDLVVFEELFAEGEFEGTDIVSDRKLCRYLVRTGQPRGIVGGGVESEECCNLLSSFPNPAKDKRSTGQGHGTSSVHLDQSGPSLLRFLRVCFVLEGGPQPFVVVRQYIPVYARGVASHREYFLDQSCAALAELHGFYSAQRECEGKGEGGGRSV